MQKNNRILFFGHLPKYIGGRQSQGLSTFIWNMVNAFNNLNLDKKIILASTDIYQIETKIGATYIIGWNRKSITAYCKKSPFKILQFLPFCFLLFFKYHYPFFNTLGKLIFYDNTIQFLKEDVESIHSHDITNSIIISHLSKIHKKKLFVTIHGIFGNDINIENYKIQRKLEKKLSYDKGIEYIIFITSAMQSEWLSLYGDTIALSTVITYGIDVNIFHYDPTFQSNKSDRISLLTIGNISLRKGQKRVLEALSLIPEIIKCNLTYSIIGNGSPQEVDELNRIAVENNISFKYLGYSDPFQIVETLHSCDYMILPSSSEGFGLAYIESISCGTPVCVPKNLPIAQEKNLLNEKNSVFIENSSIDSIKDCLLRLKKSTFSREEISETVMHLSWEQTAGKYFELYNII